MLCKICNKETENNKHFWKNHQITLADYYIQNCPRFDLHTNEIIPFKNVEQYSTARFTNRRNLISYISSLNKETAYNFCKELLLERKAKKELNYFPGEWELRSLMIPSISFFNKKFGLSLVKKLCDELFLILRYDYEQKLEFENKELNFIVDTRENSVLDVPNKIIKKLDVGDYAIEGSNIIIEKKSITDFCSTLSQNFDRFCRELDRCRNNNQYLIILIEEKFSNIASIAYLPHTRRIKATSDFIFHLARQILNLYPLNCQIVCCNGKKESVRFIEKVFQLKNNPQTIDFQHAIDNSLI